MKFKIEVKRTYTIEADSIDEAFEKLEERTEGESTYYISEAKDTDCES